MSLNEIPRAGLEIVEQPAADGRRLVLRGELDIATAPALEAALERAHLPWPSTLVIDLRRLDFLDSSGLRVLLAAYRRCCEQGTVLKVLRGPDDVHRAFQVAGLEAVLPFGEAA